MRIGIDGHVLGKNIGGVERFVGELVRRLPRAAPTHTYVVFVTRRHHETLRAAGALATGHDAVQYVPVPVGNPLVGRLVLQPWLVRRHCLDALLVQRLAPWFCGRCKLVVTIHDLTPIKFAAQYKGLSNLLVRRLTRDTARRAALLLTPTETIRAELRAFTGSDATPIRAFYNGVDAARFAQATDPDPTLDEPLPVASPYLLTVGAIEARKDLGSLVEVLPLLDDFPTMRLALIGPVRDAGCFEALQGRAAALGLQDRVVYLGFVSEPRLLELYRHAAAFVTASLDEGFNIPPLEAMACGLPVACSDIAVHRELFDGAAAFFEPGSSVALAAALRSILVDPQVAGRLIDEGHRKVAAFTWDAMARRVADAFAILEPRGA